MDENLWNFSISREISCIHCVRILFLYTRASRCMASHVWYCTRDACGRRAFVMCNMEALCVLACLDMCNNVWLFEVVVRL